MSNLGHKFTKMFQRQKNVQIILILVGSYILPSVQPQQWYHNLVTAQPLEKMVYGSHEELNVVLNMNVN